MPVEVETEIMSVQKRITMKADDFRRIDRFRADSPCIFLQDQDLTQAIDTLNDRIRSGKLHRYFGKKSWRRKLRIRGKRQRHFEDKQLSLE